jgi:hypothetical protein
MILKGDDDDNTNKEKFSLEQETKAHRGSRGLAVVFP